MLLLLALPVLQVVKLSGSQCHTVLKHRIVPTLKTCGELHRDVVVHYWAVGFG